MGAALACNIAAINSNDRPRYKTLVDRLRCALLMHEELPDGYTYHLNTGMITLLEVAEWITMERQCCPFLTFQLDITSNGPTRLTMRGPTGTKDILQHELHTGRR